VATLAGAGSRRFAVAATSGLGGGAMEDASSVALPRPCNGREALCVTCGKGEKGKLPLPVL